MSTTETLLAALRASYPDLTFEVVDKVLTAHADDDRFADVLVGVVVQDTLITEAYESTCGRFRVDPEKAYGIPAPAADAILQHNAFMVTPSTAPTA